jgi:hypothetical protein
MRKYDHNLVSGRIAAERTGATPVHFAVRARGTVTI